MSFNDKAPPVPGDSDILNHVMRMVIPMRREYNRSLEVRQFMHDVAYAKEIIDQALASKDTRLVENAAYLSNKMFGPRNAVEVSAAHAALTAKAAVVPSASASAPPAAAAAPVVPPPTPDEEESEAAMRARMMAKYKTGLR
jgi:hypothetical protein